MRFPEYFIDKRKKPVISFEIFPPKTEKGKERLYPVLAELAELGPSYITVTYGAMGTTREMTLDIALLIKKNFNIESACHLTCVGSSRKDLDQQLCRIYDAGISNIVAIRGDPPKGETKFAPPHDGYSYASELVKHIRDFERRRTGRKRLGIAVGGYPEKHPESPDFQSDVDNLKRKIDNGADIVITQLFFDNSHYFKFVRKARSIGITAPIIPGLMPILSVRQIERITSICGSTIPVGLKRKLDKASNSDEETCEIGIAQCIKQTKELLAYGAPGVHFYVLNKSHQMRNIIEALKPERCKEQNDRIALNNF